MKVSGICKSKCVTFITFVYWKINYYPLKSVSLDK